MSEPFIGEIRIFPYSFAPLGWAWCNGQAMSITQSNVLYAVIGTLYGGDGRTCFNLPDLRGRAPMHQGTGIGLTPRGIGQPCGSASVQLTQANLPSHGHTARAAQVPPNQDVPDSTSYPARIRRPSGTGYEPCAAFGAPDANLVQMSGDAIANAGANYAHLNSQPFLGLNFCIALEGIYPSRN